MLAKRVDHRVADKMCTFGNPLAPEVLDRAVGMSQECDAQVVCESAIVLLRHSPIETAETCLEVRDG
jgi:hypothetical protein